MLERAILVATSLAAIGSGLAAGVFFAFSSFVMPALGAVPERAGIAAMNAINVKVITPSFMLVFLGTALLSLALAGASLRWWGTTEGTVLLVASVVYLVGCFGVTMAGNVPLNDALAAVTPETPGAGALWTRYLVDWTRWNHVRTAACLLSAMGFVAVLVLRMAFPRVG